MTPEATPGAEGASQPQLWSRANVPTGGTPSPGTVWVKPGDPLPVRQWVERLLPLQVGWFDDGIVDVAKHGLPPSKHTRTFYHPGLKLMVIAGGDRAVGMPRAGYADATGTEIVALDVSADRWSVLRPFCVPGEPQPNRPDNVNWVYDSKRDRGIMAPGYYANETREPKCGALEGWGAYAFDFKTGKFSGPNAVVGMPPPPDGAGGPQWGGDQGASFAVYDPVEDELVRIRSGPRMERLNLMTQKWRLTPLTRPEIPNWNPIPNRAQSVIDVVGRAVYWLDFISLPPALMKTSLVTGTSTVIPLPAQYVRDPTMGGGDVYLVFDPIRRQVIIPNNTDMGGFIHGLGFYDVVAGTWTWETPPLVVTGTLWGFEENLGALIVMGKRCSYTDGRCGPERGPYAYYLWKYGPKP